MGIRYVGRNEPDRFLDPIRERDRMQDAPTASRGADEAHAATESNTTVFADLATWLRGLVWTLGPVAPRTRVVAPGVVKSVGERGGTAIVAVSLVNRQRAAVSMVMRPSPLRSAAGYSWFPVTVGSCGSTVPADEERSIELMLAVPAELPAGVYVGTFGSLASVGDVAVLEVEVVDADDTGAH